MNIRLFFMLLEMISQAPLPNDPEAISYRERVRKFVWSEETPDTVLSVTGFLQDDVSMRK
ncbi:hypothetical protein AA984_26605 [Brevibacillus formosus]|uniref:Uncharacterized protein n=1 Tax=Brevibacillus formosus TaxID=54913 RepID=A0A837KIL4_9BACL|nr:hypothetical protein AA984_26605 [Brevibacillus formosus]PSJ91048.1 hypothetical protein C7R91_26160 [Brevibacillus formosus]GED59902.1 hypothetical protein BFO01nite_40340 [Brevibacillus formosus]